MMIRWRKVLREIWSNTARTVLVVLSITVGVFAVGTIANSWVVLLDDLNTAYLATNPASATLTVEPFGDDLVSAVESRRDIAQAEGRGGVNVQFLNAEGEKVTISLAAVEDFDELAISQFTPEEGAWPPARREFLLERSYA
ncbi:MAG: ABC transporter permease, partial [Chloroflexi bacterium]|nr:ABC transporter permease [Chloroflexota bacterium]